VFLAEVAEKHELHVMSNTLSCESYIFKVIKKDFYSVSSHNSRATAVVHKLKT
jgi:hypothetical protein